jgi:hypothetical protein
MGLWSYYFWAVRRGPTRRSAIAIPIPFEPKQERICLARPSTSNRRAKTSAVVSAVLSGFPVSCANFQCAEDSARYSQRIRHICPRFGLYETFSAKGAAFSASPPQDGLTYSLPLLSASRLNPSMSLASLRLHSPWRTWGSATGNPITHR